MEEEKEVLTERVLNAIKNRNASELREIFETVPNIDIAECLDEVDDAAVFLYIFRTVSSEYTSDFFAELTTDQQELIINAFTDKQLIELLENSFADDIVDTLEEMPANVVNRVLKACPADLRKDVNNLLNYKDNTAGSVMTTEYLDMKEDLAVKDAIKIIRKRGKDAETVYTIFVRDSKRNLKGTINLDDLIFADEDEKLEDIMDRDFVTCNVNDDQEEVANMFKRYDLNAMAVVNNENKIVGIITIDDVVDIIVEEATEDIAHLNQISNMDEPYLKTPVHKLIIKCVPWLITLIILHLFSALIISGFEEKIATLTILSFFMTLVADAGGNAGGQTTTLIVRSISLDEFDKLISKMKNMILISMNSVKNKLMRTNNVLCFEIFGYDFIIDKNFKPYILEINNNPGLGISSPLIEKIIQRMLDDAFRLTIDKVFNTIYDKTCIINGNYISKYKLDGLSDNDNIFEFLCNIKE